MGVLKKFEQRLEGLVNGTFAKVFKSEVQPVEIAGALQRECDNNATIWNRDRTVVPNDFIVELSTPDFERLSPYSGQLGDELAGMVRDYAKQQRYTFMGTIKVHLEKADDLDTGLYRVRSRTLASSANQQATPERAPAGPPPAAARGQAGGYGYPPAAAPPMPAAPPPGGRPGAAPAGQRPAAAPQPGGRTRHWIEINGNRHQISRPTLVLGRSTEADVRIDDPGVSRRHCEIRTGTPSTVQDLGSTNGIVVDGQHTTRATLRDGSRLRGTGQMGRCLAPCLGDLDPNLHRARLDAALDVFLGDGRARLLAVVDGLIAAASAERRYERAGALTRRRRRIEKLLDGLDGVLRATHSNPRVVVAPHPRGERREVFWVCDGRIAARAIDPTDAQIAAQSRELLARAGDPHRAACVTAEEADDLRLLDGWLLGDRDAQVTALGAVAPTRTAA